MNRKTIAVIFGGCSSEYSVSLQSAYAVLSNLKKERYHVIPIGITQEGQWFRYTGDYDQIPQDTWCQDSSCCMPAIISPDKKAHGLLTFTPAGVEETFLDAVFPVLHGKNGEDGTLQGLIELAGIPLIGCDTISSALCMDKDRAHKLVAAAGVLVPASVVITEFVPEENWHALVANLQYPLFVKPVKAGSSYGISKVLSPEELTQAIRFAFTHDNEVIIEENIDGFEVGCAVYGNDVLTTGRVDEIELGKGFFDFTEKYTDSSSTIHMPARIDKETEQRVQETSKLIYKTLGCKGFARVDSFLTPNGNIVFNEVNTIPGFTDHSRYPSMMRGIGLSFTDLLDKLVELGCGE